MSDFNQPDFSHLPDVAWVRIMTYLGLGDRARVAATCHALNDIFNHPSLWHTVSIQLLGDLNSYTSSNVIMPQKYLKMIQRFGAFFQDLSLIFVGSVAWISTLSVVCKTFPKRFQTRMHSSRMRTARSLPALPALSRGSLCGGSLSRGVLYP